MKNNVAITISIISLLGIIYLTYYQTVTTPNKLQKCHEIAVGIEKTRHAPVDDLNVTNRDVSSYMKNMVSCFSDK
jgi:hypothetical protein